MDVLNEINSIKENHLLSEFVLRGTENPLVFSTESESIFEKIEKGSQLELEYESEEVMEESSSEETYLDNINDFDVVEVISCDTESDGENHESHSLLPSTSNIGIKIEVPNIKAESPNFEDENEFFAVDQEEDDINSWNGDLDLSNVMNEHNYTTQNHTDKLKQNLIRHILNGANNKNTDTGSSHNACSSSSNNVADAQVNEFVDYIADRINSFQTERAKELEKILTEQRDLFVQSIMDAVDEEDRNDFGNYSSVTSRKVVEQGQIKSSKVKTVDAGTNTIDPEKIAIDIKTEDPLPKAEVKISSEDKSTETDEDYILEETEKLLAASKLLESSKPVQCDKETQSEIISELSQVNYSEPMEYMESYDWNEPNEESLTEDELNLKKLATLAKNMYDRCISLKQAKEKEGFNVKDLIKEQFYKLKELAQYNFDNVEISTQTDPNMSRRKLKKLKRKLLASSGSSSDSSSDESILDFVNENNTAKTRKNHVHSSIEDVKSMDDYNDTSNLNITSSQEKKVNRYLSNESLNSEKKDVEEIESKDGQVSSRSNEKIAQETKKSTNKTDKDSEIEKLLNLDNIRKRPKQNLQSKPKKIKEKPLKSKNDVLDFLDNDLSKISGSDESNSEDDSEEKLTEKQYLARYNEKLKNQLLNESSDDDEELDSTANDLLENLSNIDGGHSPLIDKFLETFNADSEFDEIDEDKVEEDNVDTDIAESNANKSEISTTSVKNTTAESKSNKSLDDDNNNKSIAPTPDNSDCELLNCSLLEEKRTQNKSLEKLIKEADRRKKLKKIDEDLISLSSDTSSSIDNVVEVEGTSRIIKPMLRQDQLAIETRKAQKRENERIRRLEKNKAIMEKALKKREKSNKGPTDLILDYLEETETFVKVHPEIVKNLKAHQIEGIKFMYDTVYGGIERNKKSSGSGCILAHCMGLGKTLQLIALLHTLISYKELQTRKILVLCPKSTVMNWDDELKRWLLRPLNAKNLKVFKFNDQSDILEKISIIKEWSETEYPRAGCLLLGYEAFRTLVFYHSYKKRSSYSPERLEEIKISIEKYLLQSGADLVVCDEGHIIKNNKSATSLAVAKIITRKRIVLTGTPIQNNLKEYYSMVNFIKPHYLGTEREFGNLYANPIKNGQHKDSSKRDIKIMKQRSFVLHKKLSKFVQRKEAELLKSFLPQKFEYVLFVPMTDVQNSLYEYILGAITKREENRGKGLITDYTCLRKIWTHPKVLENAWKNAWKIQPKNKKEAPRKQLNSEDEQPDDVYDIRTGVMSVTNDWWRHHVTEKDLESIMPSNKLRTMFEILRMCEEKNEKCLIFSAFVAVLDVVEYFFKKINGNESDIIRDLNLPQNNLVKNRWAANKDYYRLDGKTPKSIRHEMIKQFNSPNFPRARVFLISAKAGGQGINLIGANRVIILDTSWNPSNDQQNIFRIFRLGQKKNCYVYRLLAMGTMEEKVYSRSVTKQAMSFRVVDEQQIDRHYSMAELAELYTLTKPDNSMRPVPVFPQDSVLANLLRNYPDLVYKYHEHDSLLENKIEQELSEQEKADAWAAYERDLQQNAEFANMEEMLASQNRMNKFLPPSIDLTQQNFGQYPAYSPYLGALFDRDNFQNPMQQLYMNMVDAYRKSQTPTNFPLNPPSTSPLNMMPGMLPGTSAAPNPNPLAALGDLSMFGGPKINPAVYGAPPAYGSRGSNSMLSPLEIYQQSFKHLSGLYNYNNPSNIPKPNLPNPPFGGPHEQYLGMPFSNPHAPQTNGLQDKNYYQNLSAEQLQQATKAVESPSVSSKNGESIPTSVIKKGEQMPNRTNENGQSFTNDPNTLKNMNATKKSKTGTISVIPQAQLQSPTAIPSSSPSILASPTLAHTSQPSTSIPQNNFGINSMQTPPRIYQPATPMSSGQQLSKPNVYPQKLTTSTAAAFERFKNIYTTSNSTNVPIATSNVPPKVSLAASPNITTTTSSNMGISYGNKLPTIGTSNDFLKVSNEMQIIPTTSPPGTSSISKQFNEISPSISLTALHDLNVKTKPSGNISQSNKHPSQTFISSNNNTVSNSNSANKTLQVSPKIIQPRSYANKKLTTKAKESGSPVMTVPGVPPMLPTTTSASASAAAAFARAVAVSTPMVANNVSVAKNVTSTITAQGKSKLPPLSPAPTGASTNIAVVTQRTQSPVAVAVIKRNTIPNPYVKRQNEQSINSTDMPQLTPKATPPLRSRSATTLYGPNAYGTNAHNSNIGKSQSSYMLNKHGSPALRDNVPIGTGIKRSLAKPTAPPTLTPAPRNVSAATITAAKTLAAMKTTTGATISTNKLSAQPIPTHLFANTMANTRTLNSISTATSSSPRAVNILQSGRAATINSAGISTARPANSLTTAGARTVTNMNSQTIRTNTPSTLSIKNIGSLPQRAVNSNTVQKAVAGGQYIIEGNINDRRIAIGTPTKSGGGTTITKVPVQTKRKIETNVLPKDFDIKRAKMTSNKVTK